jgi:uncharacterized protein (TIGR02246 family)
LWAILIAAVAAAVRAQAAPISCAADDASVRAVRTVADGIVAADNRGDLERVLAFYADDAILMPPGSPPVSGRAAIRPRYESLFAGFAPAIEGRIDEACESDGLGYVRGHNGGRLRSRDGGADRVLDDAYLMLLRRGADGTWRITHLMWHAAGPSPK